jgi:hypothetical protein
MSAFNFEEEKPRPNILAMVLNILTIMVVLAGICLGGYFAALFAFPSSMLNPFPPQPLPTLAPPPSPTVTPLQSLPPTYTPPPPTETPVPRPTNTPAPTLPPTMTPTQFIIVSLTPVAVTEELDLSDIAFELKGEPLAMQNFARPELGCDFLGIAGRAFELNGGVLIGATIELGGFFDGSTVELLSLTGASNLYGEGSYEFILSDRPLASTKAVYVQLLDQAGLPLSDKIFFDTFDDCESNLIMLDFQETP